MKRYRLNLYIEDAHATRLAQVATMRGVSKSSVVGSALMSYLSPESFERLEANVTERVETLARQCEKLSRDQNLLIETLALFVRYHLSVSLPIPDAQQDAARAKGKERFSQFVTQLARHIQRGNSLVREVEAEIYPESREFQHDAGAPGQPS
jgi:hypothetical protein